MDEESSLEREEEKPDIHHNVPTTRGGSDDDDNGKPVDPARHPGWHVFADNKLPTEAIRLGAIGSIGRNGRTIDPQIMHTLFQVTTLLEWAKLYLPNAVVPTGSLRAMNYSPRQIYRHTTDHLQEENMALRYAQTGLERQAGFPHEKTKYPEQFTQFFGTDDMTSAIERALVEHYQGELTWTGSLRSDVRRELFKAVQGGEDVELTTGAEKELQWILRRQERFSERHLRAWRKAYQARDGKRRHGKGSDEGARRMRSPRARR